MDSFQAAFFFQFINPIVMKQFLVFLFLSLTVSAFGQTTYDNFDDFEDACEAAQPGDEIILAAGRYEPASIKMVDVAGTAANPVIIRAELIGADTLDADTFFELIHCSYVTIQGFVINITEKSTTFKIQTCNNIRITQNILDGSGESYLNDEGNRNSSVWISIQGYWDDPTGLSHHNRIDHNILRNKKTLGNMIRIDGTNDLYVSQYDVIEYNHFQNMGPRATNEMEAIRIGWSAMSESDGFCTLSNNLFEECNGDPEIVSVKCNKNTISHNTFLRCQGTLSLRHGNESLIEGNFFLGEEAEGTGGVRVYGSDHVIINNYFEGLTGTKWDAPITLTYGDAEEGSGGLTNHFRIERALIANNTLVNNHHGIEVGYDNQTKYSKPPRDVVLANNLVTSDTGVFVTYINPPDNMTWDNNLFYATDDASISDGVTLTGDDYIEADPLLVWDESLLQYRATATSPEYTHSGVIAESIQYDIDGQFRSANTQYGADEHQENPVLYTPLTFNDVGPDLGEYMQLSVLSISAPMAGDTIEISVSSNLDWDVSSNAGWATIDPSTGSGSASFSLMIDKNESGMIRTASITVTSNNAEEGDDITSTIQISQAEKEPSILTLDKSVLSFTAATANKSVAINSNVDWTVATEAAWLDIDPLSGSEDGTLTVTVEENQSRASRNGTVTVSGDELEEVIAVSQEGSAGSEVMLTIIDAIASTEQEGNIADNVYDGILSNRWSGEGDGSYISLELEKKSIVSYIKVGLYKGDERYSYFDIQTSIDGEAYYDALSGITSEITSEPLVIYDFTDTTSQFVRIIGHGNSTSEWNSFTEFEVWGWPKQSTDRVLRSNESSEWRIYPNPSSDHLFLQAEPGTRVEIHDPAGKMLKVHEMKSKREEVQTGLAPGTYFLTFKSSERRSSHILIIE